MAPESVAQDLPVGFALLLGAYRLSEQIAYQEPAGAVRERMVTALEYLRTGLLAAAGSEVFVTDELPDLATVAGSWAEDDRWRFLVELRCSQPFYPYQFALTGKRASARTSALREVAHRALRLGIDAADEVDAAWGGVDQARRSSARRQVVHDKVRNPKTWMIGAGAAAALAGAAVVAAPAVAVLMPAASGLSGAAAVSAGLAQLGFGSIAAGGLGMVGGMWVLGAGGATVGALTSTVTQLLERPGGAAAVGAEVLKLLLTCELTLLRKGVESAEVAAKALDEVQDEVTELIALEKSRNEDGCERLIELAELRRLVEFAGEYVTVRFKDAAAD